MRGAGHSSEAASSKTAGKRDAAGGRGHLSGAGLLTCVTQRGARAGPAGRVLIRMIGGAQQRAEPRVAPERGRALLPGPLGTCRAQERRPIQPKPRSDTPRPHRSSRSLAVAPLLPSPASAEHAESRTGPRVPVPHLGRLGHAQVPRATPGPPAHPHAPPSAPAARIPQIPWPLPTHAPPRA